MKFATSLKIGVITVHMILAATWYTPTHAKPNYCSEKQYNDDTIENTLKDLHDTSLLIQDKELHKDLALAQNTILSTVHDGLVRCTISYATFDKNIQEAIKKLNHFKQKIELNLASVSDPETKKHHTIFIAKITFTIENMKDINQRIAALTTQYKKSNVFSRNTKVPVSINKFKVNVYKKSGNKFLPLALIQKLSNDSWTKQLSYFLNVLDSFNKLQ